jgi:hypothetical protein
MMPISHNLPAEAGFLSYLLLHEEMRANLFRIIDQKSDTVIIVQRWPDVCLADEPDHVNSNCDLRNVIHRETTDFEAIGNGVLREQPAMLVPGISLLLTGCR